MLEGFERQAQDMTRMNLRVPGLVVVQVDERGIELREPADNPSATEEAVLGQVDIGLAREMSYRIAEIGN